MRLALVGNWPRPYGGVAVHVAALARWLRARGADVSVLDIGRGDHAGDGVRRARGPLRYALALSATVAEGRLVHLHTSGANPRSWLVALAAGRARRPGAPRGVLTLHSGAAPAYLRGDAGRRTLARAACAGFGAVVAVSEEIALALREAGVDPPHLLVLPAYAPALLEPAAPPPALAAFRAAHRPLVAAALPPGPVYGAELLAGAFRRLRAAFPGAGLVAFGAGTDRWAAGAPARLGLGEIDHGAALAVLAAADVFVRPTLLDGDALTVREALAMGCAVVASAVGHRPPGCLLFPAGDGEALWARLREACAARVGGGRRRAPGSRRPPSPAEAGPRGFEPLLDLYRALGAGELPRGRGRPRLGAGGPAPA